MQLRLNARNVACLVTFLVCLVGAQAFSHGLLLDPVCRAAGTPNEDYQYCFGTAGCECGEFPDAGPVVATYQSGETIEVTVDVTLTHDSGAVFRFQLCPPDQLSPDCFAAGEFASVAFDQIAGVHSYEIDLPQGVECNPCVLRWKWDYGFLSCADVKITSGDVSVAPPATWTALKARYR